MFDTVKYVTGSVLTTAELRNLSMDCLSVDVTTNVTEAVVAMEYLNSNNVGYDDYMRRMRMCAASHPSDYMQGDAIALQWLCKGMSLNLRVWSKATCRVVLEHEYGGHSQVHNVIHCLLNGELER